MLSIETAGVTAGHSGETSQPRPSVAAAIVLGLLRGYKLLFSPLFAGSCRFLPSCADYAAEAVRRHGAVRGSFLAMRRLLRCHPLGGSGLDPVPEPPGGPRPRAARPSWR